MSKFRFQGRASILHLNTRKEGQDDDKELAVDVKLTRPVAMFAGKNGAGKSSIQEAVRMALTGESVRVGMKNDFAALVTEGQESGFVEVHADDSIYSVVRRPGR